MSTVAPACVGGASLDPDGKQTGGSEPTPAFVCPASLRRVSPRRASSRLVLCRLVSSLLVCWHLASSRLATDNDDDTSDGRSDADLKGASGIVADSFAGMTTVAPACVGGASLDPKRKAYGRF